MTEFDNQVRKLQNEIDEFMGRLDNKNPNLPDKVAHFYGRVKGFNDRGNAAVNDALNSLNKYAYRAKRNDFRDNDERVYSKGVALGAMEDAHERIADSLGSLISAYDDLRAWAVNRWDQGKLNVEYQAAERQFKMLKVKDYNPAVALEKEAMLSQNAYKLRGAGEFLIGSGNVDWALVGNSLLREADRVMGTDMTEVENMMQAGINAYFRMRTKLIKGFDGVFANNIQSSQLYKTFNRVSRVKDGAVVRDESGKDRAKVTMDRIVV